jgi:hypothetical protein
MATPPDADARYRQRVGLEPLRLAPAAIAPPPEDWGPVYRTEDPHARSAHDRATVQDLEARLRRLEARAAHADRRMLPRSFSFVVPAGAEASYVYTPCEPEEAFGLIVWPVDGLWITRVQNGRCHYSEHGGLDPKCDLRELFMLRQDPNAPPSGDDKSDRGIVLWPSMGLCVTVRNAAVQKTIVEGALLCCPLDRNAPVHPGLPAYR